MFMEDLEERILQDCNFKPLVWCQMEIQWWYLFVMATWGRKFKRFLIFLIAIILAWSLLQKYPREQIDFSEVEIIKEDNRLLTDVFVKYTNTHQYLHATSCHVYHSKKSIPYSQALRFNRICSKNQLFHKRCNDVEVWLKNRGYDEKLVRQPILRARKYKRTELLYRQREEVHKNKLVFTVTSYLMFSKLKNILLRIQFLLTPDRERSKVFENITIIGFKKGKIL